MTITAEIFSIFKKELENLSKEINSYPNEDSLWVNLPNKTSSAGALTLHLIGNIQQTIGILLYHPPKISHWETATKITRKQLTTEIELTIETLRLALSPMRDSELKREFPQKIDSESVTTGKVLIELFGHLTYHLGQIHYHRKANLT